MKILWSALLHRATIKKLQGKKYNAPPLLHRAAITSGTTEFTTNLQLIEQVEFGLEVCFNKILQFWGAG